MENEITEEFDFTPDFFALKLGDEVKLNRIDKTKVDKLKMMETSKRERRIRTRNKRKENKKKIVEENKKIRELMTEEEKIIYYNKIFYSY